MYLDYFKILSKKHKHRNLIALTNNYNRNAVI